MTSVRKLLLSMLFVAGGLFAGCGSTDEIIITGNPYIPQNVGEVRLVTNIQGVQGQVDLSTSNIVPTAVTDFRFSGYDTNGNLVLSVVKAKAANVTLSNVPVQVTNFRIELLAGGLPVGGVSVPVTVTVATTTVIDRPTFVFLSGTGTSAPVYGSFTDAGFSETGVIDFVLSLASVGVTRVDAGIYQVSTEGDYLVSYNLGVYGDLVFEVLNNQDQVVNFISFTETWVDDPGFSFVVSLDPADGRSGFRLRTNGLPQGGEGGPYLSEVSNFTIVRIGPSTGASLPDNVIEDGGGEGGEGGNPG